LQTFGEDDEEAASSIGLSAEEGLSAETKSAGMLARVGEAEEGLEMPQDHEERRSIYNLNLHHKG
jgi:hypothetical protein